MTDLLTAARQALPGLEWKAIDNGVKARVSGAYNAELHLYPHICYASFLNASAAFLEPEAAAKWLRTQVTARRDALDAALGEIDRGEAVEKLKTLAGLVTFRGHDTRCNAFSDNTADCGCGYITARAEARRLCGVKDA